HSAGSRVTEDTSTGSYFNNHVKVTTDQPYDTYKSPYGQENHDRVYYAHNSEVPLLSEPDFSPSNTSTPLTAANDNPSQVWDGCVWARWESSGPTADTEDGPTSDWPGWSPRGPDSRPIDPTRSYYMGMQTIAGHYEQEKDTYVC